MAQLQTYKIKLLVLFFLSLVQFYLLKRAAFEWTSFSVNQSMDLISGFLLMFRVSQLFSVNFFKLHYTLVQHVTISANMPTFNPMGSMDDRLDGQ